MTALIASLQTKKPGQVTRLLKFMVEHSIAKTNTVIMLEKCYLQINRNWFVIIGNLHA